MKKIAFYFSLAFLLIRYSAQSAPVYIDIDFRTGMVDNNQFNTPLTTFSTDDSWQVKLPGSSVFQPVKIGIGMSSAWVSYFGKSPQLGWLSPYLDMSTGQDLPNAIPGGTYVYKYNFNYSSCCTENTAFTLASILAEDDDQLVRLTLNNHVIWDPSHGGLFNLNFLGGTVATTVWGPNPPYINQGSNELIVEVLAGSNQWTGLEFDARLQIITCTWSDLALKDEEDNSKIGFCLDEDILMHTIGSIPGYYTMKLFKQDGAGTYNQEVQSGMLQGYQRIVNLKDLFEKQYYYTFATGNYKLEMTLNLCCGEVKVSREFVLECCGNPEASFSLVKKGGLLTGSSNVSGNHIWTVHQVSPSGVAIGEPWGFESPSFLYEATSTCYLVKHRIENECGIACGSQRFCNFACEEKTCNIDAPTDLSYDPATQMLSWTFATGAANYIVEVIANGCCGSSGTATQGSMGTVTAPGSPHPFDPATALPADGGLGIIAECYLVRVYAICPDGGRSLASNTVCITN